MPKSAAPASSIDPKEIKRFEALAEDWWDEDGPMAPLHKLNPVRLAYIRDRICGHLGRPAAGRIAVMPALQETRSGPIFRDPTANAGGG